MDTQKTDLERWTAVDHYFSNLLVPSDLILEATLQTNAAYGLPAMDVSPLQGKMLMLLAQMQGARHILEIGTLGAYSTIWLARALPAGGKLITLEADPKHAAAARMNIACAGLSEVIDLRFGQALETLPQIAAEGHEPFDLIFIDADKQSNWEYFEWALKLSRPGSVIIVDNIARGGEVVNAESDDPRIHGVRRFSENLAAEPRVSATAIQTVGSKGHDGFVLARVL
ncbi:MAG: O-methyltransferase [Janthinobacterium lividum]